MFAHKTKNQKKVFVGLSGGVDSAVSAALLKRAHFDVTGVFIRIALPGYPCPAIADRQDAMRVAAHLRIPFQEIDLSHEYEQRVFAYMLEEFRKGNTPNPDTLCNREIKFGLFYEYSMKNGADFVATGHYAQIKQHEKKSTELYKGRDENKDQSYFLWMVGEEQLSRTLFPVGHMDKTEVRVLAKKFDLPNARRKDSQGICFLGDISMQDMLIKELRPKTGPVISESGEKVGSHKGVELYTLGQRHGFSIDEQKGEQVPQYVIAKDIQANTITISKDQFPKDASATEVVLTSVHWIGKVMNGEYHARYRYRQKLIRTYLDISGTHVRVVLLEPHYIPIGQSLVLYKGERCIGGGIVDKSTLVLI